MAINGDGYFVVEQPAGLTDNQPQFNGVNYYTRAGDFQLNQNGYLVNGSGYYLMGIPIDATHRESRRQRSAGAAIRQQFRAGAGDDDDQYQANLPSNADDGDVGPERLPSQSDRRRADRGGHHRYRRNARAGRGGCRVPAPKMASPTRTTLASLGINSGDTITINDGTNTTTYTSTGYRHRSAI